MNKLDANGLHPLIKDAPLYKQVKAKIVESLAQNEWRLGEQIPTEPELANRFGVAISTVRAALAELNRAGVLSRKQGKGTFVAIPSQHSNLYQFFRISPIDGARSAPSNQLVSFRKTKAEMSVIEALELSKGRPSPTVYAIKNIMRFSERPVAISSFFIPERLFPGLTKQIFSKTALTPFGVYQKLYGISIVRTLERLYAIPADRDASQTFGVDKGYPLLDVHRIAYTFNDVPVELRRSIVLTRDYCYLFDEGGAR